MTGALGIGTQLGTFQLIARLLLPLAPRPAPPVDAYRVPLGTLVRHP